MAALFGLVFDVLVHLCVPKQGASNRNKYYSDKTLLIAPHPYFLKRLCFLSRLQINTKYWSIPTNCYQSVQGKDSCHINPCTYLSFLYDRPHLIFYLLLCEL